MKPVAICISKLFIKRANGSTENEWTEILSKRGIPYEIVDCYKPGFLNEIDKYSALIWHYSNFVNADLMEAQHILDIAESKGLRVYPNHNTGWHFDDKIAEMYALEAVGAPIPESWAFFDLAECLEWLHTQAKYPLVAKLRRGSGSNNVKLLKNESQARSYAKRMFSRGYSPAQSLGYKTFSKVQSTRSMAVLKARIKKIPKFLLSWRSSKGMPTEKGYCYFQEFIENEGFDLKVAVFNDKCSYLVRRTRKGSFKASGSGDIFYNKDLITDEIVRSAFDAYDKLNLQCIGFDYVVRKSDKKGMIVEMCHGFDHEAVEESRGYWNRSIEWIDMPFSITEEIVNQLIG